MDRYLATDFYNHVTGRSGTEDFKRLAAELRDAPERSNVIEFIVAEDDLVIAYMTITRTIQHDTTILGHAVEGRGQSYTVHHVHIDRVADGKKLGAAGRHEHAQTTRPPSRLTTHRRRASSPARRWDARACECL